jgi:PGF-pre-PGF domain-containing protein
VNLADGVISTQENIERYSPGGPEILQIPANPPVPINVVVDTAIHTGIGWNAQPRSRDDTIFIIGASSTKIDQSLAEQQTEITSQANSDVVSLLKNKTGRYRLTGEVVSTSQVAESLPEGAVFLIYDIEQISETIEFTDPSQGLIQTDFGTLRSKITEQLDTEKTAISPTTKTGSVAQVPGDSTSRVTLSGIRSGSVSAQQLTFNTTTAVQDVSVSVSQPATTPDPPTGVLDVLNISTSIADSRIQQSKIQLQVYNAAVPADRELIVYRYDGNSWVPVSTNTVRTTETTTTVASTVSDFSYFAVGHTDTDPTPDAPENETSEIPENNTSVGITRTVSSSEVSPGEQVIVTTELTGVSGRVSTSSNYDPQVASATVQSVTVNTDPADPTIAESTVNGSTVTVGDVGTDATVTITEELTAGEETGITHGITGNVTAGGTTAEVDPASVTVAATEPQSVVDKYDVNNDGTISIDEISQAASAFIDGDLSIQAISRIASEFIN